MKIEKRYYVLLGVIIALLIAAVIALTIGSGGNSDEEPAGGPVETVQADGGGSSEIVMEAPEESEEASSENVIAEEDWEEGKHQKVTVSKGETKETTEEEWNQMKQKLFSSIQVFDFQEAYNQMEEFYQSADTTGENGEVMEAWRYSLALMSGAVGEAHGHKLFADEQAASVNGMTVPELAVAGAMGMPDESRVMIIIDGTSKLPLFADDENRSIAIGQPEKYEGLEIEPLSDEGLALNAALAYMNTENLSSVYRVPFKMDDMDMTAVVVKNEFGEYRVFHIVTPEETHYETVQFWRDFHDTLNGGNN